jgi:hypothetical protein
MTAATFGHSLRGGCLAQDGESCEVIIKIHQIDGKRREGFSIR